MAASADFLGTLGRSTLVFANKETLDENQVIEIRVFNDNEELHLYRRHGAYEGRYVCDGTGEVQSHVDALARLWGIRRTMTERSQP